MSSAAAPKVTTGPFRSRLAPLLDAPARLRAVPDRAPAASRLPFVALVTLLLVGGVVGLLCFNTSMQQAAFSEQKLQDQATNLAARQETLSMQLQRLQDPQAIAAKAQALGMVIPAVPALLEVPSGKVEGTVTPANRDATPPLYPHIPKPRLTKAHTDTPAG